MIDEKKLIEQLKAVYNEILESGNIPKGNSHEFRRGFSYAMRIVEFQPKVGEWIPCSERLPELHRVDMESDGEYYMISDTVIITDGERISISEYEVDDGDREGWLACECEEIEDVIAWMPIPEPYQQKGE